MILDTDVLVWILRGNDKAIKLVEEPYTKYISIITFLELLQGAKSKEEVKNLKDFLRDALFHTLPLTENIGHRALVYMEEYSLKSGLNIGDVLIAATAVENRMVLCTGNNKHYRVVEGLEIKIFRP